MTRRARRPLTGTKGRVETMLRSGLRRITAALLVVCLLPLGSALAETMPVEALAQHTHIHGLAVDREVPGHLLIATHHGVFRANPEGQATRISAVKDFMGFSAHPAEPRTYFGSGHPPEGGNLGFIVSMDGGATWTQRSPGANGPVDFHQLAISPVDPDIIYGAYGALQRSVDGGQEWSVVGPLPSDLISLAASAVDADTLYAATRTGLHRSEDGGMTWSPVLGGAPVSLVKVTDDARIFAFIPGQGIAAAQEADLQFALLAAEWGNEVLLHLAIDPEDADRMFAASHLGNVFRSIDGGATWEPVRGSPL